MKVELLDTLLRAKDGRRPAAVVSDLDTGAQALVVDSETTGDLVLDDAERKEVLHRIDQDLSGVLSTEGTRPLFVDVHAPPPRLAVIGAVHITQHLIPMAQMAGYDVVVIDPREFFASEARFPGVTLDHEWPDEALEALGVDARTAVVTLTHDPKLDDPALMVALRSPAFYVGALGSTRTHAKRVARLTEHGLTEAELARLHAPIGLRIGARTPMEIALSIMAEITAVRRGAA